MLTTSMKPVISPAIQCIQSGGVSAFIGGVQGGALKPALAFGAVGAALDRYVGSAPSRDYPRELHSLIKGLPEGVISSDLQDRVLGSIDLHWDVVEKAARIYAINAEAPLDLPSEWRWIPYMTGGFFMLDHPVSNAEFRAFLDAIGKKDVRKLERKFAGGRKPAVQVIHEEATAYSRWLGKQMSKRGIPVIGKLPAEDEWEKAAKGPDGKEFVSSRATTEEAHYNAKVTRNVDHRDVYANGYGLMDMMGNVWEWTSSRWRKGASDTFEIRGSSWSEDEWVPPYADDRIGIREDERNNNVGFRPILVRK